MQNFCFEGLLYSWNGHCTQAVEKAKPVNKEIKFSKIPKETTGKIQPPLTAKGYPWYVRRISHNSPHMSLDITWTSQGYRLFRLTGYNPVGLKYPAQDIRIYNEINNDSKI